MRYLNYGSMQVVDLQSSSNDSLSSDFKDFSLLSLLKSQLHADTVTVNRIGNFMKWANTILIDLKNLGWSLPLTTDGKLILFDTDSDSFKHDYHTYTFEDRAINLMSSNLPSDIFNETDLKEAITQYENLDKRSVSSKALVQTKAIDGIFAGSFGVFFSKYDEATNQAFVAMSLFAFSGQTQPVDNLFTTTFNTGQMALEGITTYLSTSKDNMEASIDSLRKELTDQFNDFIIHL